MPDTLIAIDPSSSAFGWSRFIDGKLAAFGVIRHKSGRPALERIDAMLEKLRAVLDEAPPDRIVMEISGGKTHGRLAKASGLSVLGHAQGEVRRALIGWGYEVATITENEWTGRRPKTTRAARVAMSHPAYCRFRVQGKDSGLDAADAIGLAEWHIGREREAAIIHAATSGGGKVLRTKV